MDFHSVNPIKIDFDSDTIYYENFEFKNIDKVAEYTVFSSINLPLINDVNKGIVEIYISLPIENENEIDGYYLLDSLDLSKNESYGQYYYDFITKTITKSKGYLTNGVNFPVESFSLKVIFANLGESRTNYEVIKNYQNMKEFFGECEVSSFCFS